MVILAPGSRNAASSSLKSGFSAGGCARCQVTDALSFASGSDGAQPSIDRAFEAATRGRASALIVVEDLLTQTHQARIVALAAKKRLPAMYGQRDFVDAGGLMSYGANFADLFRRAATYVDKILKGAKPADLPVEQPTRFELVINQKTAKALGLTFPPSILIRTDQVIQ